MRPQGSPEELERRRRRAVDLLKAGASVTEVARRLSCSHSSVILWRDTVRRRGLTALTAKPAPGRPPKLTARQRARLPRLLLRGAAAWGFETELWTTRRIATVIQREFGVRLHRAHVGRVLSALEWSCQKPEPRAIERDDAAIERWKRYRWVAIKKSGAPEGPPRAAGSASICTCIPDDNITNVEVAVFLRALLRHLRGHVIIRLDSGSIHKGPAVQALEAQCPRLPLEWFPGYAPELNPDELVWAYFKAELANGHPDTLDDLMTTLCRITKKVTKRPELIRSFITGSDLPSVL